MPVHPARRYSTPSHRSGARSPRGRSRTCFATRQPHRPREHLQDARAAGPAGLVQRFEIGEGVARYEPAYPSGEHHHHIVCENCGTVRHSRTRAWNASSSPIRARGLSVTAHDVTLHGECPASGSERAARRQARARQAPARPQSLDQGLGVRRERPDVGLAGRALGAQRVGPQRPADPDTDSRATAPRVWGPASSRGTRPSTPSALICSTRAWMSRRRPEPGWQGRDQRPTTSSP